jgi:alkylation response protein AidB-like acyl-CoA dehydrogenase
MTTKECKPLAPKGAKFREWTFLERYPELSYLLKDNPRELRKLEQHYARVLEFTQRYVAPKALEIERRMYDDPAYVPHDLLAKACEYQLFSGMFPGFLGGPGIPLIGSYITFEVLATECVGVANLLGVSGLAIGVVMSCFDPRSMNYVAELICANERRGVPIFLSTCVSEPGAGSDAEDAEEFAHANLKTTAVKVDGGYRVTGTKVFISNGSLAALHVVTVFEGKKHRPEDLRIMLVPRGAEGLSITRSEKKMGQKVCPASEVVFDNVFVPDDMVCRSDNSAHGGFAEKGLANVLGMTRAGVGSFATGVAEGAYRTALKYARTHKLGGKPMDEIQWVRVELADMAMRAQVARATYLDAVLAVQHVGVLAMIDRAAGVDVPASVGNRPLVVKLRDRILGTEYAERAFKWFAARQSPAGRDTATSFGDVAKVACSDLAMENCQRAVSLMGKDGLRHEFGAEKLLRDVKLLQIYEGTNQINTLDYLKRRLPAQFGAAEGRA